MSENMDMTDPGWSDFVLSHLAPGEYVEKKGKKYPNINGLRRLTRKFVGPIISGNVTTREVPSPANDFSATVEYFVTIMSANGEVSFSSVADSNSTNTDAIFRRYPSAMAETRAEGRALRKALQLNVAAIEELSEVANDDSPEFVAATKTDFLVLKKACENRNIDYPDLLKKHNINVEKRVSQSLIRGLTQELNSASK